jgi:glycosyltransferase involved in cell wall biosynthesis
MRILFVSYGSSIHTARWISQLHGLGWDLHLFPVDEYLLCREMRDVTVHYLYPKRGPTIDSSVRQATFPWPFRRGQGRWQSLSRRLPGDPLAPASRLASAIRRLEPDLIHSMDLDGGLLALEAFDRLNGAPPPHLHSSWGSGFYHYGTLAEYRERIQKLMRRTQYLMADCRRELELAPSFGFQGETLGVFSAAGGFHLTEMRGLRQPGPPSQRRLIAVKGRHTNLIGRSYVIFKALELTADLLRDHRIVVYLPQGEIRGAIEYLRFLTGLEIEIVPDNAPHEQILSLLGSAKLSIAMSMSDGTPHAMLESMVMGAFPIQSNTADTRGWIEDGFNGRVVPPEDPLTLANAIRDVLTNPDLIDHADQLQPAILDPRIDISVVRPTVIDHYRRIAGRS